MARQPNFVFKNVTAITQMFSSNIGLQIRALIMKKMKR
jgi:hypothetical protein